MPSFQHIITPFITCDDQMFLSDVGRSDAVEMAVSQHSGVQEAMSVGSIKQLGFTYEHDVMPQHLSTSSSIATLLYPTRAILISLKKRQDPLTLCIDSVLQPSPAVSAMMKKYVCASSVMRSGSAWTSWPSCITHTFGIIQPQKSYIHFETTTSRHKEAFGQGLKILRAHNVPPLLFL
jgi:hypothetical protein